MRQLTSVTLIILFAALALWSSCEKEITVDLPPYKEKLVVNCAFNNQSPMIFDISQSRDILSSSTTFGITDGVVKLYENGVLAETVPHTGNGKYESALTAQLGKTYFVTVSRPGFTDVSATASLPKFNGNLSVSYKDSVDVDSFGFPVGELKIAFSDDASETNYYKIKLESYNTATMSFLPMNPVSDDPLLVDGAADTQDGGVMFSDLTFNGRTREFKFRTEYGSALGTPKYVVRFELIPKEYHDYLDDIENFEPSLSIISSEPVLIYTNIANGLGIFAGTYLETDTIK